MVTNSSAIKNMREICEIIHLVNEINYGPAVGWSATHASKSALVAPVTRFQFIIYYKLVTKYLKKMKFYNPFLQLLQIPLHNHSPKPVISTEQNDK